MTRNIVNASYLFTQFSTLAKTYTTTAREPSINANNFLVKLKFGIIYMI